ncbi:class I SAM-dependent methyltransferase [Vibrio sp. WJH972]
MNIQQLPIFFGELEKQLIEIPNEARRLFHGRGQYWEGLEQLTADWLQGQLIVCVYKLQDEDFIAALQQGLSQFCQSSAWRDKAGSSIVLQHRYRDGAPAEVIVGELNSNPIVEENGLKYQLKLGRNQNMGLFLDMRYGRQWVKDNSAGKRVLNLFAYTCGFSVTAMEGGAESVVNVDMARGALDTGKTNHKLNLHDLSTVHFFAHDIFRSWGKINRYGPYDLIIIDPPSFQKGSFALTKDYRKILRRLPDMLSEEGQVFACVNSPVVKQDFLTNSMAEEAPMLQFERRLDNPPEFVDIDQDANLKVLLFNKQD